MNVKCLKWAHMTHLDTSNTSYCQKKVKSQNWQFDSRPLQFGNPQISLCTSGLRHIVGKLPTRAITLFQTSSPSKVCTQSYGPPKLRESQLWEFRDSHLGILKQNDIWVLVSWPGTKYTIRGKVMASPKSRSLWVLWIRVCLWLVRAPKCSTYALTNLLFGLWVIKLFINFPNPIPELQHAFLPSKCYELGGEPQFVLLLLSSPLDSQLNPSRSLGVRHYLFQ